MLKWAYVGVPRREARRGEARRGEAHRGEARRGEARRGEARLALADGRRAPADLDERLRSLSRACLPARVAGGT